MDHSEFKCSGSLGGGSAGIDILFYIPHSVWGGSVFVFVWCVLLYAYSSFIVFLMPFYCKCLWLFHTVPLVGLQFVIVLFSDHSHSFLLVRSCMEKKF